MPCLISRQHMHHLYIGALCAYCIKLILEDDVIRLHRAVKHSEFAAGHFAVRYFLRHRVKRRDAAAAHERNDLFRVAQRLPIERAERQCAVEYIADVDIFKN